MPELPEVETVMRGLAPVLSGAAIVRVDLRRPDLRFPLPERFAERLEGRRVDRLRRRAKYILADIDDGSVLVMHLGMSGSFRIESGAAAPHTPGEFHHARSKDAAHDHVVVHLGSGTRVIYNDPRRFGFMALLPPGEEATHPLFRDLGLEPLGEVFDGHTLARLFAGRAAPLKSLLLDQKLIAGLGNIYACEALWRARLSPRREARSILRQDGTAGRRAEALARAIREVLAEAVEAGGSSLRDYVQADGELGLFQHRFAVYDREGEPCQRPACRGVVKRVVQGGRSTFFCGECQR